MKKIIQPLKVLWTLTIIIVLSAIVNAQTTRYVPAQYSTIQAAANSANNNDTIKITGTITECGIYLTKSLVFKGNNALNSIIQGAATPATALNSVFTIDSSASHLDISFIDLSIRNGYNRLPFSYNMHSGGGAIRGIYYNGMIDSDVVNIINCNLYNNKCEGRGGAILLEGRNLLIKNSAIFWNTARYGGAIAAINCDIQNSTISENTATFNNAGITGLYCMSEMYINNSTIANNIVTSSYNDRISGIGTSAGLITVHIKNSILTNDQNISEITDLIYLTSYGNNLVRHPENGSQFTNPYDIRYLDPILDSISLNDGYTYTNALSANSPAINRGSLKNINYQNEYVDQRYKWVYGNKDIGAYEYNGRDNVISVYNIGDTFCPGTENAKLLKLTVNWQTIPLNTEFKFTFRKDSSTNSSDIDKLRLYYTGSDNTFSTSHSFPQVISDPDSEMIFTDNLYITRGNNFFWLVVDIEDSATTNNIIRVFCQAVDIGNNIKLPNHTSLTNPVTVGSKTKVRANLNNTYTCVNDKVTLSIVLDDYDSATYQWYKNGIEISGGSNSILTINSVKYSDSGLYRCLINDNCFYADESAFLYIKPYPEAGFTINDVSQCLDNNLFSFSDVSTISNDSTTGNIISSFTWSFGDSCFSNSQNSSHHYTNHDTFEVQLKVISNFNCSDSVSKTIYVHPQPKASFFTNDSGQCFKGNNFTFYNTSKISSGNMTFSWFYGDGGQTNADTPVHRYSLEGLYSAMLIAESDPGCRDSFFKHLLAFPMPNSLFEINDSSQCLLNNSFVFNNISSGSIANTWSFNDGDSSSEKHTNHSYSNHGSYNVQLVTVSDKDCYDTFSKKINVFGMPETKTIKKDIKCHGDENGEIELIISKGCAPYKVSWSNGKSGEKISELTTGSYSYDITDNNSCSISGSEEITQPDKIIIDTSVTNEGCRGEFNGSIKLSVSGGTQPYSYSWSNGSTKQDLIDLRDGIYLVVVRDSNECTATSDSITVSSFPIPQPYIEPEDDISICEGNNTVISVKENYETYDWNIGTKSKKISVSEAGKYFVKVSDINNCKGISDTITVNVVADPAEHTSIKDIYYFCSDDKQLIVDAGYLEGASYLWFPEMDTLRQTSIYEEGTFRLKVSTSPDCYYEKSFNVIELCTPIIYIPNSFTPDNDGLNDHFYCSSLYTREFSIDIYNKWGEKVYAASGQKGEDLKWDGTYRSETVPPGIYYYHIKYSNENTTTKQKCGSVNLIR